MKKVLITGISGQDGVFLTNILNNFESGYEVIGISRNKNAKNEMGNKLRYLNPEFKDFKNLKCININLLDSNAVENIINDFKPDYVYNLSGPSSVYESVKNPFAQIEIESIFQNLTNSLIKSRSFCNFYQASSSEMFKNSNLPLNERSEFEARSPYARGKLNTHYSIGKLRDKYDWNIISGITFNHESEFRKNNYLIMEIIDTAIKIKKNLSDSLLIGSLKYKRDWSYAGDIAEAMLLVCENGVQSSYVIGRGEANQIKDIIELVFSYFNLDYENFIKVDSKLLRQGDPNSIISEPKLIKNDLNWSTRTSFEDLILKMLHYKTTSI